jgi:type 1 glutamine amidotransferase/HEAT repeat protein
MKGKKMRRITGRSKAVMAVCFTVCLLWLLADFCSAVTPEELQKIENAAPAKAVAAPKKPRKVLVFNLCSGFKHSSIPYWDKALEIMGRKTGAYEVVVSSDMAMFKPGNLKQFDAVCLNNTTKLDFSDKELRRGLMGFVSGGKGLIGIHAASDNFYDWPEAAEMIGCQFSGHPWRSDGTWAIKIDDPMHPLTAAFGGKGFKVNDELYRTDGPLYSRSKQRVLLSLDMNDEATAGVKDKKPGDDDTGISWVKAFGKGRVFYCSLGHNHHIIWDPAVLQHYLAGIQFALGDLDAATAPAVERTVRELLAEIAKYEYGKSRRALSELDDMVRDAHGSPQKLSEIEGRFVNLLRSDATDAGKQYICRKLSIIGTEKSVPTLSAMLTQKATSQMEPADMARYALERIVSPAADEALRQALPKTSGTVKVGIINSIGNRGDKAAVGQLAELAGDSDKEIALAAMSALGKIGGDEAAVALKAAKPQADNELYTAWADAYLMCADKFLADGDSRSAIRIYRPLYARGEEEPVRFAAFRGMVMANPERAVRLVVGVLKGQDQAMQSVAIGLLREIPGTEIVQAVTKELPNLSPTGQVQVLSALSDRGDSSALAAAIDSTRSSEVDVRIAAYGTVAALGDALHVGLLAKAAATTSGAEQESARRGLYRLRASDADEKILASVSQADSKVKVELIRSVGERNIKSAVETLLQTAKDSDVDVRTESIKVLKEVASPEHLSVLVDLLLNVKTDIERTEAESTVIAVARKIEDKDKQAEPVLASLPSVKGSKGKASLMSVLGKIGGSGALRALRQGLNNENSVIATAAVRALSDWPNAKPLDDLKKVAQTSSNHIQRVLALRGFIRLIGVSERPAQENIRLFKEAMSLAGNANEKKMVLSGLGNVRTLEALQLVAGHLDNTLLQAEAEAAVVRIAEATGAANPQQTKTVLAKVKQNSKNDSIRQRAQELIDQIEKKD